MLSLFVPLLLSATIAMEPLTAANALESPKRHVRTNDGSIRSLLRYGFMHSASFAALIARLEESDVFVYIEEMPGLPVALDGRLLMQRRTNGVRYVRIQIALRGSPVESVAVLGHELQHATEVADAPDVEDDDSLVRLYERIGLRTGRNRYETIAAQEMGRRVLRELVA
jgi:hypothetical protein